MESDRRLHKGFLVLGTLLLVSCMDAGSVANPRAMVEFGFSRIEGSMFKNLDDVAVILITIEDDNGSIVHDSVTIELYGFGDTYLSRPIGLVPGTYALTEFVVLDDADQALYATPMQGSPLAHVVAEPLPIGFTVTTDSVTTIRPQVVSVDGYTPEDFGYVSFGPEQVHVIDFLVAVFIYDDATGALVLTTATLEVEDEGGDDVATLDLTADTNQVLLPDGHELYQLEIAKPGYDDYEQTFTAEELAAHSSSDEAGPLIVVLEAEPQPFGRVFYLSNASGTVEVWSVADDGSHPVRHTQGVTNSANPTGNWQAYDPAVSWDGQRVVVASPRQPDGSFSDSELQLWHLAVDGSDFRRVARLGIMLGYNWEGDSSHVVYTNWVHCTDDLHRIDASTPGATGVQIFNLGNIAARPAPNPTNRFDVLFHRQSCGQVSVLHRLDLTTGGYVPVPGVGAGHPHWSSDGSRFAYNSNQTLYIYDASGSAPTEVMSAPPGDSMGRPRFGNDDDALYVTYCASGAPTCDIARVTIATGQIQLLGVDTSSSSGWVSWAEVTASIDDDGDGLANGIDPTP